MIKSKKGFSLLEILVAMALVALIFSMAANFSFTRTQASQELVDDLTIAIESATDEAVLKNSMVRVRFKLSDYESNEDSLEEIEVEDITQKIFFEYLLDSKNLLESRERINRADLTQTQMEEYIQEQKKNESSFGRLSDLKNGKIEIEYPLRILGIGYPQESKFITTLSSSIYFYPNGDKNPGTIFIFDQERIHYLVIPPFGLNIKHEIIPLEFTDDETPEQLFERATAKAKETFEKLRLQTL